MVYYCGCCVFVNVNFRLHVIEEVNMFPKKKELCHCQQRSHAWLSLCIALCFQVKVEMSQTEARTLFNNCAQ